MIVLDRRALNIWYLKVINVSLKINSNLGKPILSEKITQPVSIKAIV